MIIVSFAACPVQQPQQTIRLRVEQRPSIKWPDDWKQPEPPEHDHPSDEDPSPVFLGLGAANINVSNVSSQLVVANDSGATGNLYTTVAATWLPIGPYLATATRDLDHGERFMTLPFATNIAPDTKKHLANPSTHKAFEWRRGRGGRF
jgi:hypothetical protein